MVTITEPSPIPPDELRSLDSQTAAMTIRDWRPDPDQWPPRGAGDLAHALRTVVKENVEAWVTDPIRTVSTLRHPTYINGYLRALAEAGHDHDLPTNALLDVIRLVRRHPWKASDEISASDDQNDFDSDWQGVEESAVALIKTLTDKDVDFGNRSNEVWDFLESQAEDLSQPSLLGWQSTGYEPHQAAINRSCTKALDTVVHLLASESRLSKAITSSRAAEIFEQSLRLTGVDGAEHRAILAPRIQFLMHVLPEWTKNHLDLFFGTEAPEDLAQLSFDQTIKWGQPKEWLLKEYRPMLRDAVRREIDRALDFMLIAMLCKTPGYSVKKTINFLKQHPTQISKAGRAVARLAGERDIPPKRLRRAIEFWCAALKTGGPLDGFGWFSDVNEMDDTQWVELTLETLRKNRDRIDWGNGVIKRLKTVTPTEQVLEILRRLVQGPSNEWERLRIQEEALHFLSSAEDLRATVEYRRFQSALRERGLVDL